MNSLLLSLLLLVELTTIDLGPRSAAVFLLHRHGHGGRWS